MITSSFSTLLVDGYISHSFSPSKAERYFFDLLKTNSSGLTQLCQAICLSGGVSFVVRDVATRDPPLPLEDSCGRSYWLLDHSVMQPGTVVPQHLWSPQHGNDFRQYVTNAELQMPVFFIQEDGYFGLSLDDAARGRCHNLRDARTVAHLGGKTTTFIRINWPGYHNFKRQVQIRDETPAHNPITLAKFAYHIGRSVESFIRSAVPDQNREPFAERWKFGPYGVNTAMIRIIGAIHVSAGSWMPILQLNNIWLV
ncbi:hypothetical protein BGW80DRAFT_1352193 [Lactifluus volemus]|nr:hypothetical protein BGW80DRAFT_1352193 [Lactifluus volemus]